MQTLTRRALIGGSVIAAASVAVPTLPATAAPASSPALIPGITQRTLTSAEHSAFPSSHRLKDGRIGLVYRQGNAHVGGSRGAVMWSTGSNDGATWAAPRTLFTAAEADLRDPSITGTSWGLVLTYFKTAPDQSVLGVWMRRSVDDGATWTDEIRIDSGAFPAAITSPVVEVGGRVLIAFYYDSSATNSVAQATSRDGGDTWRNEKVIADGSASGRHYNEPVVVRGARGRLVLFCRWGMRDGIARMVSADEGRTWSSPNLVLSRISGRPTVTALASGAWVMVARRTEGNRAALAMTSSNAGRTWSTPRVIDVPRQLMTYAALLEIGPGVISCVFGSQLSPDSSSLLVRYLVLGTAVTPFGERVNDT